jgi:hypothetical protein
MEVYTLDYCSVGAQYHGFRNLPFIWNHKVREYVQFTSVWLQAGPEMWEILLQSIASGKIAQIFRNCRVPDFLVVCAQFPPFLPAVEPGSLGRVAWVGEKESDGIRGDLLVPAKRRLSGEWVHSVLKKRYCVEANPVFGVVLKTNNYEIFWQATGYH